MLGKNFPTVFVLTVIAGCAGSPEPQFVCAPPQAPALSIIHGGATLVFDPGQATGLQVGMSEDDQSPEPDVWLDQDRVSVPTAGLPVTLKVFARATHADCPGELSFAQVVVRRGQDDACLDQRLDDRRFAGVRIDDDERRV